MVGEVTYHRQHRLVERAYGSAKRHDCFGCGAPAREWAYQYTAPPEFVRTDAEGHDKGLVYSLRVEDYAPMCHSCNQRMDYVRKGYSARRGEAARLRQTGRRHPASTRRKMSESHTARWAMASEEVRAARGEAVRRALKGRVLRPVEPAVAQQIRTRVAAGESARSMTRMFGVTRHQVYRVLGGAPS